MAKPYKSLNFWIFIASLIALAFVNNASIPLWNADESAYAGISKAMFDSGNWMIQDFFMSDVHRKPPLHFWLMSISYSIFGINEWAVRFPSALAVLASAFILFKWVKEAQGEWVAQLATGIFCTNFLVIAMAKVAFVDAHLLFCCVLLGRSFYRIVNREFRGLDVVLYWLAIGLGILVKGPQILIFGGLLFLGGWWMRGSWSIMKDVKPWFGLPLALMPIILWAYSYSQYDGGKMISWMWDWYILKRAQGEAVFSQTGPPGYYLGIMLISSSPFLVGLVLVIRSLFQKKWQTDAWFQYLIIWLLSGWLLYEFIPSKLPTYTIAAYPALSILIAGELTQVDAGKWKSLWMRWGIFFQMLIMAIIGAALLYFVKAQLGFWGLFLSIIAGLTLLVGSIVYVLQLETGKFDKSPKALLWSNILFLYILVLPIMNLITPQFDCPKRVAQSIMLDVKKTDKVLLAMEHDHMINVPFYLSCEAELDHWRDPAISIAQAEKENYKIVIADSNFIQPLSNKYTPRDTFNCWDMNSGKEQQYIVLERL